MQRWMSPASPLGCKTQRTRTATRSVGLGASSSGAAHRLQSTSPYGSQESTTIRWMQKLALCHCPWSCPRRSVRPFQPKQIFCSHVALTSLPASVTETTISLRLFITNSEGECLMFTRWISLLLFGRPSTAGNKATKAHSVNQGKRL